MVRKTKINSTQITMADGKNAPMTGYLEPRVSGPGIWWVFHKVAYHDNKLAYEELTDLLLTHHPCVICRKEFNELMFNNDDLFDDRYKRMSIFERSVFIHNIVNSRLLKPIVTVDIATSNMSEIQDLGYLGPGIWWCFHASAVLWEKHNRNSLFWELWNVLVLYVSSWMIPDYRPSKHTALKFTAEIHNGVCVVLHKPMVACDDVISWFRQTVG